MEHENKKSQSDRFFSILKNLFFALLIIQFLPSMFSSLRTMIEDTLALKTHVGYLTIDGPITDASFYIKKIDEFAKASDIKGLFLRINSPGGYTGSCNAIFNELQKFKEKKPITTVIENVGASGAYYLAIASNTIIASPLSLVGSIGVFMEVPNVKDLLTSWKVQYRYIQSGHYKTTGSAFQDLSAGEAAYLQQLSDNQYEGFVHDVAQCRNISAKEHTEWADGKIFTGTQALALKLVDKLGSFSDARNEIKRLLHVDGEIKFIQPKKITAIMRLLGGEEDYGQDSMSFADHVDLYYNYLSKMYYAAYRHAAAACLEMRITCALVPVLRRCVAPVRALMLVGALEPLL